MTSLPCQRLAEKVLLFSTAQTGMLWKRNLLKIVNRAEKGTDVHFRLPTAGKKLKCFSSYSAEDNGNPLTVKPATLASPSLVFGLAEKNT